MAAGYLQPPGTEYGPCVEACEHTDCASTRRMADAQCAICGEPIGYVYGFYQDKWTTFEHAICAQRQVREERDGEAHNFADYACRIREGTREQQRV